MSVVIPTGVHKRADRTCIWTMQVDFPFKHSTHLHMFTINTLFSLIKIDKTDLCTIKLVIYHWQFFLSNCSGIKYTFFSLPFIPGSRCVHFIKKNKNTTDKIHVTFVRRCKREQERKKVCLQNITSEYQQVILLLGEQSPAPLLTDWLIKQGR